MFVKLEGRQCRCVYLPASGGGFTQRAIFDAWLHPECASRDGRSFDVPQPPCYTAEPSRPVAICPLLIVMSGGQTGVDRAALDVALSLGYQIAGWCPRGRRAEDGRIPEGYPLTQTATGDYAQRTDFNVRDSDATLLLFFGDKTPGTKKTEARCAARGKPLFLVDLQRPGPADALAPWLVAHRVRRLNVAGPRASGQPAIYWHAKHWLFAALPVKTS